MGEDIYSECLDFLDSYRVFEHNCLRVAAKIESRLAISISDVLGTGEVMPRVKNLMRDYPDTEILLEREILSGEAM